MKHAFLRRLGALALALAMAASLCVTPAMAASAQGDPFQLSTKLIILKVDKTTNPIQVESVELSVPAAYVKDGDTLKWVPSGGATVNGSSDGVNGVTTTVKVDDTDPANPVITGNSVQVSASNGAKGTVTVTRYDGTTATSEDLSCYVYGGVSPTEENLTPATITVDDEATITVRVLEHPELFNARDIEFYSAAPSVAAIDDSSLRYTNDTFTVKVIGKSVGSVRITMTLKGAYSKTWTLKVDPKPDAVLVTEVWFEPGGHELTAGDTLDLKPTLKFLPEKPEPTSKEVSWRSSNTGVATVREGVVTAVGAGTATITAITKDGSRKSGTCTITVKAAPASLKIDQESVVLNLVRGIGPTNELLTATADPSRGVTYSWTTSNSSVVDFKRDANAPAPTTNRSSIRIYGHRAGTATITVTAQFSDAKKTRLTKSCIVNVLDDKSVAVTGLTLNQTSHSMAEDGTFNLSVASFTPANAPVKTVTWSSGNRSILEVESVNATTCKVIPVSGASGQANVIATAYGGAQARCTITITPKAEAIRLTGGFDYNVQGTNHYEHTFANLKDELKVKAVFTPTAAADPVRWAIKKDADTSVATVSSGTTTQATITAVSPGETTITAIPLDPAGKERVLSAGPAEVKVTVSGLTIQQTVDGTTSTITSLNLAEGRRQIVTFKAFGKADTGGTSCDWSISDPSIVMIGSKTGGSTTLTARRPGTVTLTARRGTYSATCTVTVGEDAAVTITASTAPGSPLQFSKLASQLQSACQSKTGSPLSYITNLTVASTDQGILHDQHHSSADTGAGVGIQDRYYPGTAPQGQRSMNDLSFVPRNTFSGTAEITYTGWSTKNQSFNGTIRVTVNGTGDVMYSSNESAPVTFLADDFNLYHPNFSAVSFTPPLDSVGTLYYNYTSPAQPGTKVSSGTTYSRTGNPSVDRVTFVPAAGYSGTVRISYKGTDTGGRSFTGVVTITVNSGGTAGAPTDLYYPMKEDNWVTFNAADFNAASQNTLGESLAYVRFALPPSNEGTLFYNYRGFGNYDSAVANTTSYYYSGTPALSGVSFVPTTTTPGQVDIDYTGYTVKGNTFTGTIHLGQDVTNPGQNNGMRYTVFTGKSVSFSTNNFNTACIAATGASLDYVQFTQMPPVGQGTLRYTRGNSSSNYNLSTSTRCYRSAPNSWDVQLSNVYFQANANYTGTVTLPFVGYNTNGTSFTGEVTIEVTPPTATDITFNGTTASPYRLSANVVRSACNGALDGTLSYITFTSLPSATAGRLYLNYNGFRTGSQVNTGTRYYASSSPSIDQLSFVPRGRYNGQVTISFTATNTSGQSVNGQIVLNLSSTGGSGHFSDLGNHAWAAPAVDYLYENGVTNGTTPSTFGPNQRILRCDFVLMLCRAFGFGEVEGYSFADVPTNAYYAGAVAAAKQRGIINGDGERFMPNSELTRQDAMVMIYNAMKAAGWGVSPSSTSILGRFPDGSSVASYARDAVSTLVQMGAVNGDNGMLYPYNPITRAEAAVILHFVMTM